MSIFPPVLSKRDFVVRYAASEFGNRAPTWETLHDFLAADYRGGLVHVRNRVAGARTWYDVEPEEVPSVVAQAAVLGFAESDLYFSGMAPTDLTVVQGEVMQGERGLEFFYSTVARPMRESLVLGGTRATGVVACTILRYFMCPNSYEWLQVLLDRYEGHVIEFSCYDKFWGTIPNFNTVFWEIRKGY